MNCFHIYALLTESKPIHSKRFIGYTLSDATKSLFMSNESHKNKFGKVNLDKKTTGDLSQFERFEYIQSHLDWLNC